MQARLIAYSYIRFSTPGQIRGQSLERQLSLSQAWAEARGIELDTKLRDLGRSAYRGSHRMKGKLAAFLSAVRSGTVPAGSFFLIENMDRLSREEVLDAFDLARDLLKAGITIVTTDDGQEYSTATVNADWTKLIIMLASFARGHGESKRKEEMLGKAWTAKRAKAEAGAHVLTSVVPSWLKVRDKNGATAEARFSFVSPHDETARLIFRWSAAGEGKLAIARRLTRMGRPTFGRAKEWYPSIVWNVLHTRAAIGEFQPLSGKAVVSPPIPGYFPQVVDETLFYRAQAAMQSRSSGNAGRKGRIFSNLLTGHAKCATCGRNMMFRDKGTAKSGKRWVYLVCAAADNGACENDTRIHYVGVEQAILDILPRAAVEGGKAKTAAQEELEASHTKRDDLAKRVEALVHNMGLVTGPAAENMARGLQLASNQLEATERDIARLKSLVATEEHTPNATTQQESLRVLLADLAEASPDELFDLRFQIAQSIKTMAPRITCAKDGQTTVSLEGGSWFALKDGHLIEAAFLSREWLQNGVTDASGYPFARGASLALIYPLKGKISAGAR